MCIAEENNTSPKLTLDQEPSQPSATPIMNDMPEPTADSKPRPKARANTGGHCCPGARANKSAQVREQAPMSIFEGILVEYDGIECSLTPQGLQSPLVPPSSKSPSSPLGSGQLQVSITACSTQPSRSASTDNANSVSWPCLYWLFSALCSSSSGSAQLLRSTLGFQVGLWRSA